MGAVAFILLASAVAPGAVAAKPRPGSLDRSFGTGGRVTGQSKSEEHPWRGFQVAPLPGGGVIVLDSQALTRFEADGKRDRRFGRNGEVVVDEIDGEQFQPSGLATDSKGRIVVSGTAVSSAPQPAVGHGVPHGIPIYRESAAVMRFRPGGKLDPTFGNQGVFSSTFGFQPPIFPERSVLYYESPAVQATGVAIDAKNRPVLTGTAITEMGGCRDRVWGSVPFHESFVARLTAKGPPDSTFNRRLDRTFNGTGVRSDEAQFSAEAPAVRPSNGVVYLRSVGNECENLGGSAQTQGVGELTAAGIPNPAFGPDEVSGFQEARALAVDRRGRTLLLRDQFDWEGVLKGPTVQVVRLLPNGSVDKSFGRDGTATLRSHGFVFSAIATDGHGRVLLAGDREGKSREIFGLVRLRSNGSPDRRFGRRGTVGTALGKPEGSGYLGDRGIRIAVDRRERVLVGRYGGSRFDLARFLP